MDINPIGDEAYDFFGAGWIGREHRAGGTAHADAVEDDFLHAFAD